jgi:hypothetical protein
MEKKGKEYKVIASKLLDCTLSSYYNWDKQNRPIINLLEKYFEQRDIEEFLENGKINKFEQKQTFDNFLKSLKKQYFDFISSKFVKFHFAHEIQAEFYFQYLYFLKDRFEQFEIHNKPFSAAAFLFALKFKIDNKDDKQLQKSVNEFSNIIDLIEFLDDTPGMLFYFKYLLEDDLKPLLDGISIDEFCVNGKISIDADKSLYNIEEISHYYMYHSYNNIEL